VVDRSFTEPLPAQPLRGTVFPAVCVRVEKRQGQSADEQKKGGGPSTSAKVEQSMVVHTGTGTLRVHGGMLPEVAFWIIRGYLIQSAPHPIVRAPASARPALDGPAGGRGRATGPRLS